jgi:spoIIIJ-associated protein
MSPNERRIIHLALAEDPTVKTESRGDGENRKVTILPA